MDYVRRQPQFNSELRKWKFIAVCKEVDDYVKSQYKAFEDKGKVGLVFQVDNCEVYALTWDDIFKSFEIKHKPMLERLKYDRERVANELMAAVSDTEGREKSRYSYRNCCCTSVVKCNLIIQEEGLINNL